MTDLSARAKFATAMLRTAATLSRVSGRGDGSVIGGRVGLTIEPRLLSMLASGRRVALISGTNGKTTTTRFTAAALEAAGPVATNSFGANMPTGHTTALAKARDAVNCVLEVDEHYLPQLLNDATPQVVALLNLSRDQLDRAMEVSGLAAKWREALSQAPDVPLIANADDPWVTWAAGASNNVTWVAGGQRWQEDSWVCPQCGKHLDRYGEFWRCVACGLTRPSPSWTIDGDVVVAPDGTRVPLDLRLPGQVNRANAATALAVASAFGVDMAAAGPRLTSVTSVAGRYAVVRRDGRRVRLLLSKNPAGWLEAFDMLEPRCPVVLALNAREVDGFDTSWIYDVDFSPVHGRRVLAIGDRRMDLAVRLQVNGIDFEVVEDISAAIEAVPPGDLEVIANYTAFQDIRAEFDRVN
ncbi:UDP-N-acetylmuramyl tripeptide synthase [Stackebrandtia endophytica]|uniref:Lipid II isoglutaminyl synthase (glutamine-hydrolyzing) subunit MurT n=1 Tax=Stackebrandtia endophytica TaxID=1496996 RepID=A0A543B3H1_9ACTN|nr:MurT ligase domain-containing protein [Stackebrandtia endophytica]TQL79391.1 UDP-N-acetylmuramyl tripeptide synthase [Stackebrandtia endophytica]